MKQLLITGLLGLIIFTSCKKSETTSTPPTPPPTPPNVPAFDSLNGWQKINTQINSGFYDIAFSTAANGVLATTNGVYKSVDSGKTWVKETSINNLSVTINFYNQQYGYGVGEADMNITSNGGSSWRRKNVFASNLGTDVFFVTPAIGYITNQQNGIYKTTDTGNTWQRLPSASRGYNLSVFFLNDQQGWYSSGPYLLRTSDGGNTWAEQKVSDDVIVAVCFANTSNGWLTADSSVYRTTNGGANWTKTSLGSAVFDLQFLNAQTGYATTQKGVWKTTDGGATWKQNLYAPLPYFPELIFLDENTGWVTGQNGLIYRWKK